MQLGAVCSPVVDGEVLSFGTTGYTMNNTFVLYDRNTDSVWFPMTENSFDSVAGPTKGKKLPFLVEPEVMRLHKWARLHPETLVMLEPPPSPEQLRWMEARRKSFALLAGTWNRLHRPGRSRPARARRRPVRRCFGRCSGRQRKRLRDGPAQRSHSEV